MLADARTARMDMLISKPVSLWKANFLALLGKLALRGRNSLGDRELLNLLARAAGHLFISARDLSLLKIIDHKCVDDKGRANRPTSSAFIASIYLCVSKIME
jgi:hypothetical protein